MWIMAMGVVFALCLQQGTNVNLAELHLFAAERRAQALSARELANRLSDQEERQEILRYADDLENPCRYL